MAAMIPVIVPYTMGISVWNKCVVAIVAVTGAMIAIIEGVTKLYQFHENWIQYRTTSELLKIEKNLFLTGSGPYAVGEETPEQIFVHNIENLVSSENNRWKGLNLKSTRRDRKNSFFIRFIGFFKNVFFDKGIAHL